MKRYRVRVNGLGIMTDTAFRFFSFAIDFALDNLDRGYEVHLLDTKEGVEYDPKTAEMIPAVQFSRLKQQKAFRSMEYDKEVVDKV